MAFIAGAGAANVDLLYENMPKIPDIGEEVYTDKFSLQLGGGLPATLINLGRLGIETKIATELGDDMFSAFAREKFCENGVTPVNIYKGNGIPLNITSAIILENDRLERLREKVAFSFWEKLDENRTVVRFATSWATTDGDIEQLRKILQTEVNQ